MEKYMVLRFRNAKLFRNKKTKDKVFDDNLFQRDRKDIPWFVEAITVHQVSNMLHVLLGERPVPTVREAYLPYGRIEEIFDLAQESYIRIDSLQLEGRDGKLQFIPETVRLKKSMWNSWQPQPMPLYWERVRRIMGETYDGFYEHLCAMLGPDQSDRTFRNVMLDLQARVRGHLSDKQLTEKPADIRVALRPKDEKMMAMIDFLMENGKTGFVDAILKPELGKQLNTITGKSAITIVNGKDDAHFLSGHICVPVNEQWIERLRNNSGNATILDGGLVWIDSVRDGYEMNFDSYRKMSEVSLETY